MDEAEETELDKDDMNPEIGSVATRDLLPRTVEEINLRRLEDGASLTGWRGGARAGVEIGGGNGPG